MRRRRRGTQVLDGVFLRSVRRRRNKNGNNPDLFAGRISDRMIKRVKKIDSAFTLWKLVVSASSKT